MGAKLFPQIAFENFPKENRDQPQKYYNTILQNNPET
jgi:hypothetical protein